jgi:hypothetical protein
MEAVRFQVQLRKFCIGHLDAGGVGAFVEFGANLQTLLRHGVGDEMDDDLMADQRSPTPVLRDMAEHPMFDFVPLAGAGREMADMNGNPQLIRQSLQRDLPQTATAAVAPAPVGGDQQFPGGSSVCDEVLGPRCPARGPWRINSPRRRGLRLGTLIHVPGGFIEADFAFGPVVVSVDGFDGPGRFAVDG